MDKVNSITTRWNGLHISLAGRVELCRAVITPLLHYWTSVYSLPAAVINIIEKRMRNFIWGHDDINLKMHGLNWKKLAAPKEEGVREVIRSNSRFKIGNGNTIKLFLDPWCDGNFLSDFYSYRVLHRLSRDKKKNIGDFIDEGQWNVDLIPVELHQFFFQYNIQGGADKFYWHETHFTFKSAWHACRIKIQEVFWFNLCWNDGRPRWSAYAVLVLQNAVITNTYLQQKGFSLASKCVLCCKSIESGDHLFCCCDFSWKVWMSLVDICHWILQPFDSIQALALDYALKFKVNSTRTKFYRMIFTATLYYLWKERNARLHNDFYTSPNDLAKCVFWDTMDILGVCLQYVVSGF
ncbi:uncharacterized protein LOC132304917 [Cornus florida]|uniref:uncharacterized protein LOC132304917 n=1 Tax=Cornus florida TaxID=4283 RepID=UPI0028A11342|nr:uncharacterized protein LOC132304917 [Cornus florida]